MAVLQFTVQQIHLISNLFVVLSKFVTHLVFLKNFISEATNLIS